MGAHKKKPKFDWLNIREAFYYVKRVLPMLREQWVQLVAVGIGLLMYSSGFAMRVTVVGPFVKLGTDPSSLDSNEMVKVMMDVAPLAGTLALGAVLMAVGTFLKNYYMGWVTSNTVIMLQKRVLDRVLMQPMSFFNTERKGALITRMTGNARGAGNIITLAVNELVAHPLTVLAIVAVMVYTSPVMTLATFVVFPAVMVPVMLSAKRIRKASKKQVLRVEDQGNFFHQTLDGIRVVKAFRLEKAQHQEFDALANDLFRRARKIARYKGMARAAIEITYNMIMALALFAVTWLFTTAWFEEIGGLATFAQFFVALVLLYDPARKLGHSLNNVQETTVALDRIFELYDRKPEIMDRPDAREAPAQFSRIEVRNLTFEYAAGRPVLKDVDLTVQRGQTVALVGQSGMGKSTMLDLIPRFYDPVQGRIEIDGVDLRDFRVDSWLKNISIVAQDTFLFNTTVRKNILCGKPDATEEEVIEAARAAHIWEEIQALPMGLDTRLGDRAVNLSGGQRQRLAIARAFLKKAPILLLDEATSNLDTRSEREVQNALDELVEGCTVFVVAHRLSTIRNADQILLFHEGRVAERGTHDELMALGGAYANAWRLQQGETKRVAG